MNNGPKCHCQFQEREIKPGGLDSPINFLPVNFVALIPVYDCGYAELD